MPNKKADAGLTAVVIIILIIIFLGWVITMGNRECSNNEDCGDEYYCGSDFACHKIPVIEKSSVIIQRNYVVPSIILGVCIIIAAIILKWDKIRFKKKITKEDQTTIPSYSADYKYSTPK